MFNHHCSIDDIREVVWVHQGGQGYDFTAVYYYAISAQGASLSEVHAEELDPKDEPPDYPYICTRCHRPLYHWHDIRWHVREIHPEQDHETYSRRHSWW